jgi:hypothetical protein
MTIARSLWFPLRFLLVLILGLIAAPLSALTLDDLRHIPDLTPQKFARQFSSFRYERHSKVQTPEVFLAKEAGDCDDYATLAAEVFRQRGYTTRVITIRMTDDVHAVCYIAEAHCYLDYNNRSYMSRTVSTDGSLQDIARKVARSFGSNWTSAAESTYEGGVEKMVRIETSANSKSALRQFARANVKTVPINF